MKSRYAPPSKVVRRAVALALSSFALIGPVTLNAQQSNPGLLGDLSPGSVISAILVVDTDRMWQQSAFGQRARSEHETRLAELAAENAAVREALSREEESITAKRTTADAEAFRVMADAFDQKVQETTKTQLDKNRSLLMRYEREQEAFSRAAEPVLNRLMRDSGASVILERRVVLLGAAEIDITDRAIALLDETIGTGVAPD